ncbi:hypothetical protein DFH06DRAFT_1127486 [Mycena polygramma]|nr:hypothetical protein DFH06DRAFT_1127486 [Mycena polygramma]
MTQGETRLLGDKPPGNGLVVVGLRRFWQSGSIDDDASGPWLACAVHNIRVDFAVSLRDAPLPSNRADAPISSHDYFSAASPHRSHPDACPACFCSPSWSSCAWRREELYVANGFSGRDGICDRRGSSGFPPAETGWDLYLPSLERARARQGSVLQPFSLSTRTCGRALSFPEVDAFSALTNGPRFKYTLPWQLFCSRRSFWLAKPRSWQLDQLLSQRPTAHARNESHMPIAFGQSPRVLPLQTKLILALSTIKSTSLAFARQPLTTHSALIFAAVKPQSLHGALVYEEYRRDFVAPGVRSGLPNPARDLGQSPRALPPQTKLIPAWTDFSDSDEFSEDPRSSPPPSRSLGNRPPRILRSFAGATTSPGPIFPSSFESSFVNSHRSRLRFSATVYDMHLNVLLTHQAAIILGLIIKVLSAVTFLRNTASTPLLQTLVTTCSSSLEVIFL